MFFVIADAVILSKISGRKERKNLGNVRGVRIYTYLMRARSCKKVASESSPNAMLHGIVSHHAEYFYSNLIRRSKDVLGAKGISKEKYSQRLSRMHNHNLRIIYVYSIYLKIFRPTSSSHYY